MMNWFTGDEHFNHTNIITKFVFRPFANSESMNETLISRHNSRVKPGDTVYHLGDFKVSSDGPNSHELMKRLNGNHVFIQGNHDKNNGTNTCLKYCVIELFGQRILLVHRPSDAIELLEQTGVKLVFCGHVHDLWKFRRYGDVLLVNVGVDQWEYFPIDPKQIFKAIKRTLADIVDSFPEDQRLKL